MKTKTSLTQRWRIPIAWSILTTLLLLTSLLLSPMTGALAHSDAITECSDNIVYHQAELMFEFLDIELDPPMWKEGYDTNGDGMTDVSTMSFFENGTHRANPVYWIVDRDHDGESDEVYIDLMGFGRCKDIKLLYNLREPIVGDPDHLPKGGA